MNYENGSSLSPADVALIQNRNNDGFGGFGGDGAWWIILFLIFAMGGWNNGGFGGFGGGFGGADNMYPWLSNGQKEIMQNTNNGFNSLQLGNQLTAINSGVQGLSTQLCGCCADINQNLCNGFANTNQTINSGFANTNQAINSGFANIETSANARQMANMQQNFNNQLSTLQSLNGINSSIASTGCDIREGIAGVNYNNALQTQTITSQIASENCQDRAVLQEGVRDIITANQNNTQSILDKLCQLELDGFKRENDQLRSQLQFANMQASQVQQTADLRASQATATNQLVSELRSCPIPAQPVYGNTPIFTCNGNHNCGCNGNF